MFSNNDKVILFYLMLFVLFNQTWVLKVNYIYFYRYVRSSYDFFYKHLQAMPFEVKGWFLLRLLTTIVKMNT